MATPTTALSSILKLFMGMLGVVIFGGRNAEIILHVIGSKEWVGTAKAKRWY